MASIQKRGKLWRAYVCVNRIRDSGTFDTKSAAMAWAVQREQELKENKEKPTETCKELFEYYLKEVSPKKRGHRWERIRLFKFIDHPIFNRLVSEISTKHICQWRDARLKSVGPATVRREMNLLGHCFEVARKDLHWIPENPCSDADKPKEPPHRERLISTDEITLIRHALGWPNDEEAVTQMQKVAAGFCFAIETAMRMGEICNLTPDDIRGNVATLGMTKNGTKREVPLSKRALDIIGFVPDLWQMDSKRFEALFRKGRDRSGVTDLVFHDTRHEAITRLAKKLDVLDLARMVGHRDIKQLMTYYNESAASIADRLG